MNEAPAPVTANSRTWQLQSRGSGFRVKNQRSELWNLLPCLRKAAEARRVSGVSLNGGLEKPLHEAVKLKTRLLWRT